MGRQNAPSSRKALSGVKFRAAKCPDVWTNRSGKTSDYSRGVVKCDGVSQHKAASACAVDCTKSPCLFRFVSSRRQITAEISTFLHKMKKPGAVPSCYIYSVESGSDSAAIAVFIPSLKPCSKPCRSYSTA